MGQNCAARTNGRTVGISPWKKRTAHGPSRCSQGSQRWGPSSWTFSYVLTADFSMIEDIPSGKLT